MADGKIYIIVTDKYPGGQPGPTPMPAPSSDRASINNDDSVRLKAYFDREVSNLIKTQVKRIISFSIENIGNFTGDYITQNEVHNALAPVRDLLQIGGAFVSGTMMTGNPIGGIIAASVAVAGKGVGLVQDIMLNGLRQKQADYKIRLLQERSGLNVYYDGSRGTEN